MQKPELLQQIVKPTLILDSERARNNIARMVKKAAENKVSLRPHFKTHQSAIIGNWFRDIGIEKITVSSLDMALYFANHGWLDITVAFSVNIRQLQTINELAGRVKLNLVFEDLDSVLIVDRQLGSAINAWIKIDTGYHRTGINWGKTAKILEICRQITASHNIRLSGILTHAGDTYHARSKQDVVDRYSLSVQRMHETRLALQHEEFDVAISVGDTPGCTLSPDLGKVDEIRPGNFIFFDLAQWFIGSCNQENIAVALACPVVARHPDRGQLVIHGGAIHFSKEYLVDKSGEKLYGYLVPLDQRGWGAIIKDSRLVSISQEHGLIDVGESLMNDTKVGDLVAILPVHSCLTANLMGRYLTLDGEEIDMARY